MQYFHVNNTFLKKIAGQACNFIKKRLQHSGFPEKIGKL